MQGERKCLGPCGKVKPYFAFHKMKGKTSDSHPVRPQCKECRKITSAQDYIDRRDFIRHQQASARHTMTEEQRQHERERIDKWEKSNPEKVKAFQKKYREGNGRQYRYEYYQRRRAFLASVPSDNHTMKELHAYWLHHGFDRNICSYCDTRITWKASIGDHVVPISRGGEHVVSNLVPACRSCNSSKNNKLLYEEWVPPNMRNLSHAVGV